MHFMHMYYVYIYILSSQYSFAWSYIPIAVDSARSNSCSPAASVPLLAWTASFTASVAALQRSPAPASRHQSSAEYKRKQHGKQAAQQQHKPQQLRTWGTDWTGSVFLVCCSWEAGLSPTELFHSIWKSWWKWDRPELWCARHMLLWRGVLSIG